MYLLTICCRNATLEKLFRKLPSNPFKCILKRGKDNAIFKNSEEQKKS